MYSCLDCMEQEIKVSSVLTHLRLEQLRSIFGASFCTVIAWIHCCDTCSIWDSICHDDFFVKWRLTFVWLLIELTKIILVVGALDFSTCGIDTSSDSKSLIQVSSIASRMLNFQRRIFVLGTHRAESFLYFFIIIQNTKYSRWWNLCGLREFLTCRTAIFLKSIYHKFHT